jgi:glycosyltransferase involved in cell wall biosynthesis
MRIFVDGLTARIGGGLTYIKHIFPALVDLRTQHEFVVLFSSQYQQELIEQVPKAIRVITTDLPADNLARRWWYQQTELVKLLKAHSIDLFYAPAESSYLQIPMPFVMLSRNPSIYAMPIAFGERRLSLIKHRLVRQFPVFLSLQRADRVVFVSHTFGEQITRQMRLNPKKTRVVYHGLSERFRMPMPRPSGLPTTLPYFVMVSSINPHKNYETLINAYATLPEDAPPLLIAGKPTDHATYVMLQALVQEHQLQNRVHFLGEVPYQQLPGLYQGAIASVFASRLETFGHPLVEGMASHTPVIASRLQVCEEICGDAALYFDPDDVNALAAHLLNLWRDPALRLRLAEQGEQRSRHFSWHESARRLVDVFEELR